MTNALTSRGTVDYVCKLTAQTDVHLNSDKREITFSGERWSGLFVVFLKYLDIQWKTKPLCMEKFLINDCNDLGWLPFRSFPEF